jgi:hypothetical protein
VNCGAAAFFVERLGIRCKTGIFAKYYALDGICDSLVFGFSL